MGCPTQCVLGQNLTFTVQAADATNTPATPTGNVSYAVYEDTTTTEILTGTMTKDFDNKTGFCLKQIACTAENGFEQYKTYQVRITATVSSVALAKVYSFLCLGIEDSITASSGALTSTANFKSYIGKSDSDDDTLIGALITRATDAIEAYTNRTLRSASYRERYDGDGSNELLLNQYPVTAVTLLSWIKADAVSIINDSSDAYNARVTITVDTMTLAIDGGTNDGSDALTLSSYTLTTLVAAINALSKGWTATVPISEFGVYDSVELLEVSSLQCLNQIVYPEVPSEFSYDFIIKGQTVNPYKDNYGEIDHFLRFPRGTQNIVVRYTAGYVTTPSNLEQICIDLVNIYWQGRKKDLNLKSEKLGDHSIAFAEGARDLPKSIMVRLEPYTKRGI